METLEFRKTQYYHYTKFESVSIPKMVLFEHYNCYDNYTLTFRKRNLFCVSVEEPTLHGLSFSLHLDWSSVFEIEFLVEIAFIVQQLVRLLADIDASRNSSGLRSASQIDRVSEETIPWHSVADDSGNDLPRVDADGDFLGKNEISFLPPNTTKMTHDWLVPHAHIFGNVHHVESQFGDPFRVIVAGFGKPRDCHVLVADCFHLENVRNAFRIAQSIEYGVQLVQHVDDFHGSFCVGVLGAILRKSNNAGEEEGDKVEPKESRTDST